MYKCVTCGREADDLENCVMCGEWDEWCTCEPQKNLYEILVPTVSNDGKPFHTRFHRVWDQKIRAIAGGLTIFTPAKGQWVSEDKELFIERMIPVRIMCSSEEIKMIAKITKEYYSQLRVMYYRVSEEVFIV